MTIRPPIFFLPFPFGLFTRAEWESAYRLYMPENDAKHQAAFNSQITAAEARRIDISEVDLAYLSLVSDDLAARVTAFRSEVHSVSTPRQDDVGIAESREAAWQALREHLRRNPSRS